MYSKDFKDVAKVGVVSDIILW